MNKERHLLVVSGPSGVGKDTVVNRLMELHPEIELSVSATTREPREGEQDGVHYHFMDENEFNMRVAEGEFLENACYVGKYYGTLKTEVDRRIAAGITVVLVIEVEGAANVKSIYPQCTTVFILPPSEEELHRRLCKRGTESEDKIAGRMRRAREEMALADSYDYRIVNNSPDECAEEIYALLVKCQSEQ